MIIAVDIDLVCVNLTDDWINMMQETVGTTFTKTYDNMFYENYSHIYNACIPSYDYDICKHFCDGDSRELVSKFFTNPKLYDNAEPLLYSVGVLESLSKNHDIIFVSKCFPEHIHSKINFINKHYPFHKGFISTDKKQYVNCDVMIDDRLSNLGHAKYLNILVNTPFLQDTPEQDKFVLKLITDGDTKKHMIASNWIFIQNILTNLENKLEFMNDYMFTNTI